MSARPTVTPVRKRPRLRDLPALLEALPHLAPADLDAFESDLEEARAERDRSHLREARIERGIYEEG